MSAKPDVLEVMRRDAGDAARGGRTLFKTEHILRMEGESLEAREAVAELIDCGRTLSADLEHAIAVANFGNPEAVTVDHPIRRALDTFDAALARCRGESNG